MSGAVAAAKAIGEDVEALVVSAVDGLDAEPDEDAHHDATVEALLAPSLVETAVPVTWAGTPLVEIGTHVEIKACKRWTSNGTHDIRGRWLCKGREDGQHAALLDDGAVYVLAVYEVTPAGEKVLWALVVIPASLLDEHLRGSWYGVDRREGSIARLSWTALLPAGGDA
ncbi:hypothetical protein [Haloarcula laminariae]|uniref:hypothetical protein n=1 Tax=Haloarcula laminariae TaxID=2961577 RepID=UPI00240756C6|nr:hypothetical protein [Halomicroarcula sp. FL173]